MQSTSSPTINGYDSFEKIAEGGQSIVYLARQASTGQRVAVKMFSGRHLSAASLQRLERETRLLAALQHPNIVTVIDRPMSDTGTNCLVTRFIRGVPLDEFVRQQAGDRWDVIATICDRICSAIDTAHRSGVIHRDLKPSNILVDDNAEPFILDFGLAKDLGGSTKSDSYVETQGGQFLGSVPWASPEQIEHRIGAATPQTDIYQLGVVFYQVLSGGRFPYATDGGVLDVFRRILNDAPAELINPALAETQRVQLNTVLHQALRKSPQERYSTATDFGKALVTALRNRHESSVEPSSKKTRFGQMRLTLIFLVPLVLLGAGWFTMAQLEFGPAKFDNRPTESPYPVIEDAQDSGELAAPEALLSVNFADVRAPHLPPGWRGDVGVFVDNARLTVAKGTREAATVTSAAVDVTGDWILAIEHEATGNGVLRVSLQDDAQQTITLTLHRGRIEATGGQTEKTAVLGRRTVKIRRDDDRLIAALPGAQLIHLDATDFRNLSRLRFAMTSSGSGGGDVGIHQVQLWRVEPDASSATAETPTQTRE